MSAHDDSISLRSPRIYGSVLAATVATILASAIGLIPLGTSAFVILMVAVVVTGIPHGAIDHVVAAELYGLSASFRDQAKFYGFYLALMAVYGALWFVLPAWCLAAFLLMTMYHFGQADLAYWELPPVQARTAYLSRGLLLMGLPIAAFPEIVDPIFFAIGGIHIADWAILSGAPATTLAAIVGQHALVLGGLALASRVDVPTKGGREAVNLAVLSALFIFVHPLVAFAVYFGLWHSLGHILELIRFFRTEGGDVTTLSAFYQKAALYTVVSFVGLGALYAATQSFGLQDQMIALLFILISIMTLPHMIIVERLYQQRDDVAPVTG